MKLANKRIVLGSAAFVTLLLANVANAQSPLDSVSSNSNRVSPSTAGLSAGSATTTPAFVGKENVTARDLINTGVKISAASSTQPDSIGSLVRSEMQSSPRSIVNWDSRMRYNTSSYPNRAIVYIQYDNNHHCTGVMANKNTVVTAGHCVHRGRNSSGWYTTSKFKVFPGRDGTSSPYGSCTAKALYSVTGWTNNSDPKYDMGGIKLNCDIGNTVGYMGFYASSGSGVLNWPTRIIGYPGDKPQTQVGDSDIVRKQSVEMVCYRNDTIGGHSGTPVWNDKDNALATDGAYAFAIHAYGVGGGDCVPAGDKYNGATRMTNDKINVIKGWLAAN